MRCSVMRSLASVAAARRARVRDSGSDVGGGAGRVPGSGCGEGVEAAWHAAVSIGASMPLPCSACSAAARSFFGRKFVGGVGGAGGGG
jgi:hypothetical protein